MNSNGNLGAEARRLQEDAQRTANWKRWGSYLPERQWGTVREDYSAYGDCWNYFPHDHARSRTYRWGEDGLLGLCDRECRLCFAIALWNGRDPILKERLFGLTNPEGNHGEDVKECYYYLDSTPTHSYMKGLYKYPQAEFPYAHLVEENRRRSHHDREFELTDTGVFDQNRYFDVTVEYGKAAPDDILIRVTIANRGDEAAQIHLLPMLWFRNTWSWGRTGEGYWPKGQIERLRHEAVRARHASLGNFVLEFDPASSADLRDILFTENESNNERLFGSPNPSPFVKDAFHDYVVNGRHEKVNPEGKGSKCAGYYQLEIPPGGEVAVRMRLYNERSAPSLTFGSDPGTGFDATFTERIDEADEFYAARLPAGTNEQERHVARQAFAGLLWSKQFYHYVVEHWREGDPAQPTPPHQHRHVRNDDWRHVYNRDIISMPDKWEYPWFAAWDLAFHMIPLARLDPQFAKEQLILLLREWYMHPNGEMPAYEFEFSDCNPPVHAWACYRVYKMTGPRGGRDVLFLSRVFKKLLLNFTWWVNRKDVGGRNLFAGGFLGLDNIGLFDRSRPLPSGGQLEQADGTAWMAFFCSTMLAMSLELARTDPSYEDIASKFFEHFVAITDAMNTLGGTGLWDEEDGFYYDKLALNGQYTPLKIRSMVGLIPLFAVEVLDAEEMAGLHGFSRRMNWFLENRSDLAKHISYMESADGGSEGRRLLAVPSRDRLERVLKYMLDENEFLSPYGIRALSRVHQDHPYVLSAGGDDYQVKYVPGESATLLFGGNSNWRGPIWFPVNRLILEALERYHHFYGDSLKVECPTGSGRMMNLKEVAHELSLRLTRLFVPDESGRRACHGEDTRYADDPNWRDLVLFYEYFHGDNGRGLGASHQTGWTANIITAIENVAKGRLESVERSERVARSGKTIPPISPIDAD
ncbi:MAG: MGH1-like glycoside hydrolase domain-containing protein [Candidatus Binataceae bacterium]